MSGRGVAKESVGEWEEQRLAHPWAKGGGEHLTCHFMLQEVSGQPCFSDEADHSSQKPALE